MDDPGQPVGYMERTRLYYRALGYRADYQWAHNEDAPFTRLAKPLAQTRIALLTTASPPDGSNKDAKGWRHVWSALGESLDVALSRGGESLARTHDALAAGREERWTAAAAALATAVAGLERRHDALAEQTAILGGVVGATRDIAALERSLENNLAALTATGRFEETIGLLTASVQLLAARAGDAAAPPRRVDLSAFERTGKAA